MGPPGVTTFARARIGGKLIHKSLKTDKISVAQLRLNDLVKEEREKIEARADAAKGRMTFGEALNLYRTQLEGNHEQFTQFVESIGSAGAWCSRDCADLVCFLAYGGFRKGEAASVTWADCDFDREEILVRGDAETGTKNWTVRRVPMIPDMRQLLEKLRQARPDEPPTTPVMKVRESQKAMVRAAKAAGMQRITHHDLRHLFATRCIESGVDVPTVSRWLGHKDGGALAMKVYGHLRNQHSQAMAKKVRF